MARLVLFLHAHLPYVRHPEYPDALEEDWLYEALTETYLPLLSVAEGWRRDGLHGRLGLSLTPPLLEMLADPLLRARYSARLERLLRLAEAEVRRTVGEAELRAIAAFYLERLEQVRATWLRIDQDVAAAWARLAEASTVELAASAATHAFLPFFASEPEQIRAQIQVGVATYRRHLGRAPRGFWLPECGFAPGLDQHLAEAGLEWFFVDTHGIELAEPRPLYAGALPLVTPAGVTAFGRDPESSRQVWSADEGYPGDPRYREFYRDLGHDLPADLLDGLILPDGTRRQVGLKYHRITGRQVGLPDKALYDRTEALAAVESHAAHFVGARIQQHDGLAQKLCRSPVLVAPYDAELYGHWWFEGPEWLDRVFRLAEGRLELMTPSQVLSGGEAFQVGMPATSSWGDRGYGAVWLNEKNQWIWPRLHQAAARLSELASGPALDDAFGRRVLAQLGRALFLASASDWPFIITTGTMVPYAERRIATHLSRFLELDQAFGAGRLSDAELSALEAQDPIFPDLDPAVFQRRP